MQLQPWQLGCICPTSSPICPPLFDFYQKYILNFKAATFLLGLNCGQFGNLVIFARVFIAQWQQ